MPKKEAATVTRIKASDSATRAPKKTTAAKTTTKTVAKQSRDAKKAETKKPAVASAVTDDKPKRRNPLRALRDYFAGAWYELRQVRWPDRKATWSMTGALIIFTAFFAGLILLLDISFQYVFKFLIGG